MSWHENVDFFNLNRNCHECKVIIGELIDSDYTLDEISDFFMRKFLKAFSSQYNFVVSIIEEYAVSGALIKTI
jgi:hypothetical protein